MSEVINSKYILYLDNLQRLIMAERLEGQPTDEIIKVKNPLILHVTSNQGQINIQFFPIMFREFQADKDEGTVWDVYKKNITLAQPVTLDARLIGQYQHIFAPVKAAPPMMGMPPQAAGGPTMPPQQGNSNVIKLFDE